MKTLFKYDHYYDYEEIENCLNTFKERFPHLVDLDANCITQENRKQFLVTITNKDTGKAIDKPAFYLDGNIHAGEVTSSMCAMHTIDYLLSNYDTDNSVKNIIDSSAIYVIPRVSPDGAETYLKTPYTLRSVNKENLPEKGGIKTEDLDNDGVIRMMRIKTPYGAWKIDKDDNLALRDPSDVDGEYYDIYPEGLLEEYDGDENLKTKKMDWDLDYNRNFPYGWFPEGRQKGAGKYPLSNIETKALADFVINHPNICAAAIGHTSGGIILYPPGTKPSSKAPKSDIEILKTIAKMGEEELGYKPLNIFDSFLSSQENYDSGAFDDWMFETQGIPAYTMEYWDPASKVGVPVNWENKDPEPSESIKRFIAAIKWVKENAPEYYSDWKEFDHPVFGKVEIGGFNYKFTHQNPPEKFLLNELEASTRFNVRYMRVLPKLTIDNVNFEKLDDDTYKVNVTVGNLGYLSTSLTQTAKNMNLNKPVKVSIDNVKVLSGKNKIEIEELEGYSSTSTGVYFYGNISTSSSAKAKKKLCWLIKAGKGQEITIKAEHPKAGKLEKTYIID